METCTHDPGRLPASKLFETIDPSLTGIQLISLMHESQIQTLLRFAHQMEWPYIDESKAVLNHLWDTLMVGGTVNPIQWDWLYGMTLSGKWVMVQIMTLLAISSNK